MYINGWKREEVMAQFKKRSQGYRSYSEDEHNCRYVNSDDNNCCFVGAFIPESEYETSMEDQGVQALLQNYPDLERFMPMDIYSMKELQNKHDDLGVVTGVDFYQEFEKVLDIIEKEEEA